ncbi:hypothetical protein EDB80DRAFT_868631 [Ilyonectria destructans]|nr:hypothetical protein EDB80DRAFT_868631 [Ilyonectria destructans]
MHLAGESAPPVATEFKDGRIFDIVNPNVENKSWVKDRNYLVNDDIVIWHTFGFTHNPQVEDFPVMPAEIA